MDDSKNVKHQLGDAEGIRVNCAGVHAVKGLKEAGHPQKAVQPQRAWACADPDSHRPLPWVTGKPGPRRSSRCERSDSRSYPCPPPVCLVPRILVGEVGAAVGGVRYRVESGHLPAPETRLRVGRPGQARETVTGDRVGAGLTLLQGFWGEPRDTVNIEACESAVREGVTFLLLRGSL